MHVFPRDVRRDAAGLFLGVLLLYIWRLPSHFLAGDGGLYATIFEVGGYGHPPGYPLFSIYLQAWSWLPVESAFWGASFATAMLGALSVALVYIAARLWGAGRFGAAVGAVLFATAADVWLIHTQPEVFALHHCLIAGVLVLSAPKAPVDNRSTLLGLSALGGFGVAHHHTLVFLAPLGLWAGWRAFDRAGRRVALLIGATVVCLAAALLPYIYIVWVDLVHTGWQWGEINGVSDFMHLLLRDDYGTTTLTSEKAALKPWQQLGYLIFYSARDLLWLPFAGALAALGWRVRELDHWLFLAISILLVGPVFLSLVGRLPLGVDYLHIRKFHLPFELLLTIPLAVGTSRVLESSLEPRLQAFVFAAFVATGVVTSLDHLKTHQLPTVDQYVRHMLNVVPEEAIILGTGDHHFIGTLYMQRTRGLRDDVTYLDATLLATKWYHRRAQRQTGADWSFGGETVRTGIILDALEATGRPIFVTHVFHDTLLKGRTVEPYGPLIHLRPHPTQPPPPRVIFDRNLRMLEESAFTPVVSAPPESWAYYVQTTYADQWRVLAKTLSKAGARREAARAREVLHLLEGRAD